MNKKEITDIHEDIVKELIKILKRKGSNKVITYSELCTKIDNKVDCRTIARFLGEISCWANEMGAPMISVMVINKNTNMPGDGFYGLYSELYGISRKGIDKEEVFVKELKKVMRYKGWDKFMFKLGI